MNTNSTETPAVTTTTYILEGRRCDGSIKVLDTLCTREAADEAHARHVFSDARFAHYRVRRVEG